MGLVKSLSMAKQKKTRNGTLLNLSSAVLGKLLFYGNYSEIAAGKMPNKIAGSSDWLTVSGSARSETYQCPNTAPYIAADTDYIWFKTDTTQRIVTTAELVTYDLQRTPVKYDDATPYQIRSVAILKAGETLTESELNNLFQVFNLSVFWNDALNDYGYIKGNRDGSQVLFTPEPLFVLTMRSQLTGAGVSTVRFRTTADVIMTIANGKFYDTVAGDTGENTVRTITTGAIRAFYVKVATGDATITFTGLGKITEWGNSTTAGLLTPTNAPIPVFAIGTLPPTMGAIRISDGFNKITGILNDTPSSLSYISANTEIVEYNAGKIWNDNMNHFQVYGAAGYGLSATEIDNLLIDLSALTWAGASRAIILIGSHAARTAASNDAVTLLQSKSVTVTTKP